MKIALAQIDPTIGALDKNCEKILAFIEKAKEKGADLVVFPELSITGYPPEDLLMLPDFLTGVDSALQTIIKNVKGIAVLLGLPRKNPKETGKRILNSAALIEEGREPVFFDKVLLPDYDVFSELRYFEPGDRALAFTLKGKKIGVTICEDIWREYVEETAYAKNPLDDLKKVQDLEAAINISASPYSYGKILKRAEIVANAAKALSIPFLLCNQVGGNDGLLFDGSSIACDKSGDYIAQGKSFEEDLIVVDTESTDTKKWHTEEKGDELLSALVMGLRDYFQKTGAKKACIGLSGGIDSSVVACIAVEALGKENILGIYMPSRFSSKGSRDDSEALANALGIEYRVVSIEDSYTAFLNTLKPSFLDLPFDVTEENIQARIRAIILMAFANKFGYYTLATSNKTESAVGYSTLYGDAAGAISIIGDLTKGEVYQVGRAINKKEKRIPEAVFTKPPSAELRPGQKDSDSLPDYAILDAVIEAYVEEELPPEEVAKKAGCSLELAKSIIRKIHLSEYKRRQVPLPIRVSEKAFFSGRRYPIAQRFHL